MELKRLIYAVFSCLLIANLCSCAQSSPPDLAGTWRQVNSNSEDTWQVATITGDTIEIYWVTNGGDTSMLYWSGSFIAPQTNDKSYTWESENRMEQSSLLGALFASNEDSKNFTYENGQINYSVSMYGATQIIRLEKQSDANNIANMPRNPTNNSTNGQTDATSNLPDTLTPQSEFDGETAISQLKTEAYFYETRWSQYVFITIENNSEYNLSITVNAKFYDKNDTLVGAKSQTQNAVESGYSTVFDFITDEEVVSVDYEYIIEKEDWYKCVLSDLSYDVSEAKNKIILSVSNTGNDAAKFVQATVLFFKGDSIVDFSQHYITDNDSEIKPGRTVDQEMEFSESFDSYLIFLSGRR